MDKKVKTEKNEEKEIIQTQTPETVEESIEIGFDTEYDRDDKAEIQEKKSGDKAPSGKIVDTLEDLPESIKKKLEQVKTDNKKEKKGKTLKRKKKKEKKTVSVGKAFVNATYNNTIITLTDLNGNVLNWASAGLVGFKGPKKSTSYAAQVITRVAVKKAREEFNLEEVSVFVNGVGTGREAAIRALNAAGLTITQIKDVTPIPHNGCRPKGPRRV